MRRENEVKHQENIDLIMKMNSENLAHSKVIFLYAPGFNKSIFLNEDKSLSSTNSRIVTLPFSVTKANYTSMLDSAKRVSTAEITLRDDSLYKLFN